MPSPSDSALRALMPMAHRIAGGFVKRLPRTVLRDDVHAAAVLGAWLALSRRPELSGEHLQRYAKVRIRGAIVDALRSQDWMHRRGREHGDLTWQGSLDDLTEKERRDALSVPATQEDDLDAAREGARETKRLHEALASLPARERLILLQHYGHERKLRAIGVELGISEPRVSQLKARAVERLRAALGPKT